MSKARFAFSAMLLCVGILLVVFGALIVKQDRTNSTMCLLSESLCYAPDLPMGTYLLGAGAIFVGFILIAVAVILNHR